MTLESLSVKNFISDLPRILNANFTALKDAIEGFYDSDKDKITATSAKFSGSVEANSIKANSAKFTLSSGDTITIEEIVSRLESLENE